MPELIVFLSLVCLQVAIFIVFNVRTKKRVAKCPNFLHFRDYGYSEIFKGNPKWICAGYGRFYFWNSLLKLHRVFHRYVRDGDEYILIVQVKGVSEKSESNFAICVISVTSARKDYEFLISSFENSKYFNAVKHSPEEVGLHGEYRLVGDVGSVLNSGLVGVVNRLPLSLLEGRGGRILLCVPFDLFDEGKFLSVMKSIAKVGVKIKGDTH